MHICLSLESTRASLQALEGSCDAITNKGSQHIPNFSSCKMYISKFTFHDINLRTTRTREDMLLALKMSVFLRKAGRHILNVYWTGKLITREAFPAQLGLALLVINSCVGK